MKVLTPLAYQKAIFQIENKTLAHHSAIIRTLRILYPTSHFNFCRRRCFQQSTGLHDKVFYRGVFRIKVCARICHLAMDGQRGLFFQVMNTGNINHIVFLQRDISFRPIQNSFDIHLNNLMLQIIVFPIQNGTIHKSITTYTFRLYNQLLYGIHFFIQLIQAWTIDCSPKFHPVLKTLKDRTDRHHIAVIHRESGVFLVIHIIHLHFTTALANNANGFLISISSKTAGIVKQKAC